MQYSAKDSFQDWYNQAIKGDHSSDELSQRREAIKNLLEIKEIDFWLDSVRIYYGIHTDNNESYQKYVQECKKQDQNFPISIQNNRQIIRVIAGCAIAQKIELNIHSFMVDIICISMMTYNYLDRSKDIPLKNISSFVSQYFRMECRYVREMPMNVKAHKSSPIKSQSITLEQADEDFESPPVNIFNENMNKIKEGFGSILADINNIQNIQKGEMSELERIDTRISIIQEEINIMWWLYGGYSRDLNQTFAKLGFPLILILAPKELSDLVVLKPGLINVHNYLSKIFDGVGKLVPELTNLNKIVESTNQYQDLIEVVSKIDNKYIDLVPCLQALHIYYENEKGEEWKSIFKRKSKISAETQIKSLEFSSQIFYEIALVTYIEEYKLI